MTAETILVSWVSFNRDPFERDATGTYRTPRTRGPTLEMLFGEDSPVRGRVRRAYLLARRVSVAEPGARDVHGSEVEVVQELRREIITHGEVEVEVKWWDTRSPPTDHRSVFLFTAATLVSIRKAHPTAELVVHLSPGTPAMHATLLLSLQSRIAGDNVKAYQSDPPRKVDSGAPRFHPVPWNLLAELTTAASAFEPSQRAEPWSIDTATSTPMRRVASDVARFARVPFPVLLLGARGTGKTEIARRLRDEFREWRVDASNQQPWDFHLNCAEFRGDANMLRSALFGHAKGAHSQAHKEHSGLLEQADDDCVFLDEIHHMDGQAQALLLVALQRGGSFRRVGDDHSIPSRFRLLAASNRKRDELRRLLDEDFFDRISDLVIEMPELYACPDDLPHIWDSVARFASEELAARDQLSGARGGRGPTVESCVAELADHRGQIVSSLLERRLPGNFRDLERLARRLLVAGLSSGRFLAIRSEQVAASLDQLARDEQRDELGEHKSTLIDELPSVVRCAEHLRAERETGNSVSVPALCDEWERRLMAAAVEVAGSGTKAAELSGMAPRTFNSRREKLMTERKAPRVPRKKASPRR